LTFAKNGGGIVQRGRNMIFTIALFSQRGMHAPRAMYFSACVNFVFFKKRNLSAK